MGAVRGVPPCFRNNLSISGMPPPKPAAGDRFFRHGAWRRSTRSYAGQFAKVVRQRRRRTRCPLGSGLLGAADRMAGPPVRPIRLAMAIAIRAADRSKSPSTRIGTCIMPLSSCVSLSFAIRFRGVNDEAGDAQTNKDIRDLHDALPGTTRRTGACKKQR